MKILIQVLVLTAIVLPYTASGHENHQHPGGSNPLIEEMMTLNNVFHDIVSGVVLGNGEQVRKALEPMHGKMEKTHEGVHAGSVKLPKNNDRMTEFIRMDKQFHEKLDTLGEAAQRNDQKEMLSRTKELMDSCVKCHQMFRK